MGFNFMNLAAEKFGHCSKLFCFDNLYFFESLSVAIIQLKTDESHGHGVINNIHSQK